MGPKPNDVLPEIHPNIKGAAVEGLPDQYADGKAAKVWEIFIGDKNDRTKHYKDFFTALLRNRKCKNILDVACGTGIDSIMFVEEGFNMTSVDASDKMLKYALKERWNRRKEAQFDKWVIEEANWLTLADDLHKPNEGFDAVLCLGNSFTHLPDTDGNLSNQKRAIQNFHEMIKPGGYLFIDHRNFDYILDTGNTPAKSIYYNSRHIKDIQTSVLHVNKKPSMVTLDYLMDVSSLPSKFDRTDSEFTKKGRYAEAEDHFRLSYTPLRLKTFIDLLTGVFGSNVNHTVYGDFKTLSEDKTTEAPAFYIHAIQKL